MIDAYATRSNLKRDRIAELMDAETWMTGADALADGFATSAAAAEVQAAFKFVERTRNATTDPRPDHRRAYAAFRNGLAKKPMHDDFLNPAPDISAQISTSAIADTSLEEHMSDHASASAQIADIENAKTTAAAAAIKADQTRRTDIRARFGTFGNSHRDLLDACLDDPNCSGDTASVKLLKKLGEGAEPLAGSEVSVRISKDSRDKFLDGACRALASRLHIEKQESGNEFNGLGLPELAARSLVLAGYSIAGLTRDGIARKVLATQTTSDFPQLLSVTAGKVLRNAYESFPNTWQMWAAAGSVSDFKIHPRIQTGSFNNLATILEGGEYTFGSLAEDYENAQAVTKGKAISFTRQMLVNDDLGGFNRRAQLMGRAAARSVNVDAYAYLTSGGSNHGPTSSDTGQYFNATATSTAGGHANLTSSGTAISVASLSIGKKTIRAQKDKSLTETLNIMPGVLITPIGKEDLAREIVTSTTKDGQSNSNQPNVLRNFVTVASDPYLDGVSATAWYLFASPADIAPFEVVFLDGVQTPFIDDMIDFDTDAMKFKVRLDYGVAIGDWRAAYKNVGA
jgi:hypothetical protein